MNMYIVSIWTLLSVVFQLAAAEEHAACRLLASCLEAAEDKYANCDQLLNKEKPICWEKMQPVVTSLRNIQAERTASVQRCLLDQETELHTDNVMPEDTKEQCAGMVPNYQHIADRQGWSGHAKTATTQPPNIPPGSMTAVDPKGEARFFSCMHTARRQRALCQSLSKCCPKERKCRWKSALSGNEQTRTMTQLHLFGVRQNCLYELKQQGGAQHAWGVLKEQPIWDS